MTLELLIFCKILDPVFIAWIPRVDYYDVRLTIFISSLTRADWE